MEQPNKQPIESVQSSKNIWVTVIAVIVTALIVGGSVYAWQKSTIKNTEQSLEQQISVLQNQIQQLQQVQTSQAQQNRQPATSQKNEPIIEKNQNVDKKVSKSQTIVYENQKYGFKVEYNSDWPSAVFKEGEFFAGGAFPGNERASWRLYLGQKTKLSCYDTGEGYPYYFEEYQNIDVDEIKEILLANDYSRALTTYFKKDVLNGNEVIWYHEGGEGSECGGVKAIILGNNKIVRFTTVIGDEKNIPQDFNKILSTFDFLD